MLISAQMNRRIHGLAGQKFGKEKERQDEASGLFRKLKVQTLGSNVKTSEMTAQQADLVVDALNTLPDYEPRSRVSHPEPHGNEDGEDDYLNESSEAEQLAG